VPEQQPLPEKWSRPEHEQRIERLEEENARLRQLIDRYRRPMPDGGYNWRERAHTAHVRACDAEVENARLREALSEIKRVAYIEAPPVSDEVPAKVWKLAFDALGGGDRA
jgi:hypothetical protein